MPTRPRRRVDIVVCKPFRERLSRPWLRKVVSRTLDLAFTGESCQLGVVIADDDTLRRLNREYRGVDEVTDVLSFSTTYQGHWEGEGQPSTVPGDGLFVLPPEEPHHLGELIISYPQACRQAGREEGGLEKELALLVVHGVLHLLGFDHLEECEEAKMKVKEREVVSDLFSPVKTP
jgi:probable rRNA maturation factor